LGRLFKLSLNPSLQHCTDEAQKAETVLSAVYISIFHCGNYVTYITYYITITIAGEKINTYISIEAQSYIINSRDVEAAS